LRVPRPLVLQFLSVAIILVFATRSEAAVSVVPLGPTSDDSVTVRVSDYGCAAQGLHTVVRTGSEIRVRLQPGRCPSPPIEYAYEVPVGELPPGEYRINATYGDDPLGTYSFVVRNADEPAVTLRPWAIPANTAGTLVHVLPLDAQVLCGGPDCSSFRLEIAGKTFAIRDLDLTDGKVGFIAPAHAPGLVDMKLTNSEGTVVIPAALHYFDPMGRADLSVHERVLFPVFFNSDGAFGSRWRSEAVLSNPNHWALHTLNALDPVVCIQPPCLDRIAPRERRKMSGGGYPRGVGVLIPRGESDDLSFSLRIRDISREAENAGSQVPVVRERDMFRNTDITLLDLPRDPRYRTRVRVYAFVDPMYEQLHNNMQIGVKPAGVTRQQFAQLSVDCSGLSCDFTPFYGEFDLEPGVAGETTDVYVRMPEGALGWAFASVTNNVTQQVTVIAPDGKGGAPCVDASSCQ
jgi:hypothetical protein